ncbi:hypothetical protein H8958_009536 [Nasalis larvatus]
MSTKAEQFASKIRYLQEYHNRVLHNIYPVPSGTDIANTLKYFSQTLLSVLRDAPSERGPQSRDAQLSDYPSLDYQGLYVTLVTLLDLVPLLQHGQHDLGQSIFYTTTCLLPFLNDDILSTLPYTMISTLATFPPFLHKDIIEYLSTSFLPMAIYSKIALFQTTQMNMKMDLLYVIAYGPSQVKPPAVQMLFHYWPNLKPPGAISEYRGLQYTAWNPIHCQHIECHNAINKPAVKMCIDPSLSVALGDKPPPLYLCEECSERIAGDHSEWLIDVLLPQAEISAICQKKNCSSHVRRAVVTCFSAGCCGRHGNRPVRYCKRCHSNHHSNEVGAAAETHLYQTSPPPINTRECGAEELVCAVEAVISLLKEAEFHAEQREYELNRRRQLGLSSSHHSLDNADFDNKDDDKHDQRLLSQFGIWFLVSLCTPSENTPTESLARLVAMVFQWFHSTAYMMDDEVGSLVEKLKPQFVTKWLKTVCDVRFDVMVMCLLPKPMEFARVGGYWDKSCSTVTQLKEGLNRILCLIPYNVISQSVWECIMPEWLEAIRTEVPDNQLKEFREVLRWVLSELDIMVPLQLLISMFSDGVNSVKELANQRKSRVSVASDPGRRVQHNMLSPFHSPFQSPFRSPMRSPFRSPFKNFGHPGGRTIDFDCEDDEMNLNCFILMFDLLLKQMELQDDGITMGLEHSLSKDIISVINNVFQAPWGGSHTCQKDEKAIECNLCQSSILCYQLACELLERLAPKEESRLVEPTDSLEDSLLSSRPEFIIGPEGEEEENPSSKHGENPGNRTEPVERAAVKNDTERKFCYQQLPVTLRLIYTIFQEMAKFEEPDILFNMLNCLKILCLHGECLYIARKDHPQFLAYIQDHMLIASLWRVVKSEFSQLSSLAVPLLLHALSLPHGADIFWTIINGSFNSKDWKMRFEAVEKVAVICRFLDIHSVTKNHLLKYSLAHAFCCFLTAVEDVNPAVATRAGLLLDTIKRPALQGLCLCLDFQFDTVVKDRPTILSKLLLLHFLKQDIPALSWEFFVNRFETLSLEAQLHLDCNKEFPFPTRQQSPENDNTIKDLLPEDAGIDHQTVHQLITVLMKFMAKDESSAESDISSAKAFNTVKRHLYVLLGYDQQEGCFMIAPQKMRLSTCFNAFIAGIAQVMDYNINLGKHLLPLVVQVLKYCSCPQLRHYFQQPPRCSLWSLKPHIRQMWLKALLVILYKYPYRDCDISKILLHLIHITVNTLNAQYHSCKPHATAGPLYSDNSNISRYSEKEKEEDSVFDESDIHDTPTGPCNKESQTFFARLKRIGGSKMVKYQPVEMNVQRSEIELAEYRETGALQDSLLHCVREESIPKKKLRSFKQKSLDIGNADSLLFTLDEHRRKSCIDRCDIEKPLNQAAYVAQRPNDPGRSRQNSATRPDNSEIPENPALEGFPDARRPVIPEVRLNCMETFEVKVDSPVKPAPKEDLDLIDLSSDSTSGPEKHSILSTSDSDSLVFEPLPPLRIVESDEEEETMNQGNDGSSGKNAASCPAIPSHPSVLSLSTTPLVQVSVEDCSKDFSSKDSGNNQSAGNTDPALITLEDPMDAEGSSKPEELLEFSCGSPLTLKQKRDLLQKSFALPAMSLDDHPDPGTEEEKPGELMPSSGAKTVLLKVPEDAENPTESEKPDTSAESDTEQNPERKVEEDGAEESEFKIQIVPRQRKQRKIAVSAIQREYLDISFNILDKLGEQKDPDPSTKGLSTLEMPRESSSAPTLEAAQYRQMKRGSLGVLTMSQLMKRQLEHQSSAPHNISNWDTEQIQPGKRQCNVPTCLNPDLEGQPLRMRGATKSSLLSAPSIVSMFVPAPEEFTDEQPTVMTDKCHDCGAILEEYDEETLGLAIVVLSTFIHLSPDLAAPLLLDIMQSVGRLASSTTFSNQAESMMVPGNAAGVAKQFLRCIFHQLAPNGIFPQLFQSTIKDGTFLRTLASSLMDFNELSSIAALSQLLEGLNNKKNLPAGGAMIRCLENIATFMEALPMDSPSSLWTTISNQFQTFFAKLPCVLPLKCSLDSSLRIMICLLKIPSTNATRERDKFYLSRSVVLELLQALKLKSPLPDTNLLLLVQCGTAAMECVRQYINEVLDFMADMHTLTKLKSHMKTCSQPLHEDTFGGHLKVGLAQIAAMDISRGNHRDNKAVIRYLPWLYHPPSAMQQGPKEFIECVSHIRLLSWLLLGSLTHNAVCPNASSPCLPIPLDAGSHIADHLIVILIGFPEQSKTSVLHMCSLFHAFIFAQLWTVYCEQSAVATNLQNQNEFSFTAMLTALEFWSRVTPSILQLMAHNKVLIPMWLPMIQSNIKHLSAGLQLRLQAIQNHVNHHSLRTLPGSGQSSAGLAALRKWLQCTQFKMAQVEIQSSEATSQFYPL